MYRNALLVLVAVALLVSAPALAIGPASRSELPQTHATLANPTINAPGDLRTSGPGQGLLYGADYLVRMQADFTEDNAGNGISDTDPDDAGWDWVTTAFSHSTAPSPTNTYGETALGLYYAYVRDPKTTYWIAMTDAANWIVGGGTGDYRTASDMMFLMLYDGLPGATGTTYQDAAKAKWDYRITTQGGGTATGLAAYVRDMRGISQGYPNGIIGWDVGALAVVAAMLDTRYGGAYSTQADQIAEVLYQDSFMDNPGLFDIVDDAGWDPTYGNVNYWWYTLGISGLIDAFRVSGTHTGEIPGLVLRILNSRYPSGAVSGSYGANVNDEDWQSTAFAAMSLAQWDAMTYRSQVGLMGSWIGATQDPTSGAWIYSDGTHYPSVGGENTAGLYFAASAVGPVPPSGECINYADNCVTVPFTITRMESAPLRGYSVTFSLSPNLMLCDDVASIVRGGYLDYLGAAFWWEVLDNGLGSYTVDCTITGLPCGPTTPTGTLFTIDVKNSGGDGTGTITVDSVILRDCDNGPIQSAPTAPGTITIDRTAPTAIADLSATQVKVGNDGDGTTEVNLFFSVPAGSDHPVTAIYRKGFGHYPEYDDAGGAVPGIPATPAAAIAADWALAGSSATGTFVDETTARDFYYYVAFSTDDCGNVSAVSNMTGGTLNYHLGDITLDNKVKTIDFSALATDYGKTSGFDPAVDVGPTTNYSVNARPTTDNRINFEDLIMFAINFDVVTFAPPVVMGGDNPTLALAWDVSGRGTATARLMLQKNEGSVKGVHAVVGYDRNRLELLGVTPGALANQGDVFFEDLSDPAGVTVDVAKLGQGATLRGSGEVATLQFRVRAATARATLAVADLRGVNNEFLGATSPTTQGPIVAMIATAEPVGLGARPNPFTGKTDIFFRLADQTAVSLRIYDATGRLVRTLVDGPLAAGDHQVSWDGADQSGRAVDSGIYFYAIKAGDYQTQKRITLLR